jgi:hypothetical protein
MLSNDELDILAARATNNESEDAMVAMDILEEQVHIGNPQATYVYLIMRGRSEAFAQQRIQEVRELIGDDSLTLGQVVAKEQAENGRRLIEERNELQEAEKAQASAEKAHPLYDASKEIDEYIANNVGDCPICQQPFFNPVTNTYEGPVTLCKNDHPICNDCYATHYPHNLTQDEYTQTSEHSSGSAVHAYHKCSICNDRTLLHNYKCWWFKPQRSSLQHTLEALQTCRSIAKEQHDKIIRDNEAIKNLTIALDHVKRQCELLERENARVKRKHDVVLKENESLLGSFNTVLAGGRAPTMISAPGADVTGNGRSSVHSRVRNGQSVDPRKQQRTLQRGVSSNLEALKEAQIVGYHTDINSGPLVFAYSPSSPPYSPSPFSYQATSPSYTPPICAHSFAYSPTDPSYGNISPPASPVYAPTPSIYVPAPPPHLSTSSSNPVDWRRAVFQEGLWRRAVFGEDAQQQP